MTAFCREHDITNEICGKGVLASNQVQNQTLRELAKLGKANVLQELQFLSNSELRQRKPMVHATEALLVPEKGIFDYNDVMKKLGALIEERGGNVHFNSPDWSVNQTAAGEIIIQTATSNHTYDRLVSFSGLHSELANKWFMGKKGPLRIVPFRVEYLSFKLEVNNMVNHLIYPVPYINYPFFGLYFTRMVSSSRGVGPIAVLAFKREGYSNRDINLKDTFESLAYVGFLNFLYKTSL